MGGEEEREGGKDEAFTCRNLTKDPETVHWATNTRVMIRQVNPGGQCGYQPLGTTWTDAVLVKRGNRLAKEVLEYRSFRVPLESFKAAPSGSPSGSRRAWMTGISQLSQGLEVRP